MFAHRAAVADPAGEPRMVVSRTRPAAEAVAVSDVSFDIYPGEMLGIASGTSKAQLHRARRLLAQQLEGAET